MKTKKEIREKIKRLEDYLEKGEPITDYYPLDKTESFLDGIKWVLEDER